jgi:hypothetical protein
LNIRILIPLAVLALQPALVVAQPAGDAPAVDASILRLQDKAEDLYRRGHWERAYFIYVNELAAAGDKYAQYMAGYMHLHGHGVQRDDVMASAWFRLAAERDYPEFVEVRDELLDVMTEEELAQSDATFIQLRQKYSDLVLALGHLRTERKMRREGSTGSRVSGNASSIVIVDPGSGTTSTRAEQVRRLESRMRLRLDYIADEVGSNRRDIEMSEEEFNALAEEVRDYLQVVNDRQQDPR